MVGSWTHHILYVLCSFLLLVEFYLYTTANIAIWFAELLHTITHYCARYRSSQKWTGFSVLFWGCYLQRPKAEVDNTLRDLQNSSHPTKAEFNNCFIIHSKYLLVLKGVSPFHSLFFRSPNITQPCSQVFAVNSSIICSGLHFWRHFDVNGSIIFGGLHFWRHWFNMAKILSKFGEQLLVMRVVLISQKWGNILNNNVVYYNYWVRVIKNMCLENS